MERIKYFDGLRAIAAFIVLGNHIAALFFPWMFNEQPFGTTPLFALINGETAVIIFFILSGYLISNKYFAKSNNEFLISTALKRYFTLVLPCLFSIMVGYIIVRFSLSPASKLNPNYTFWSFVPSLKDAIYQGTIGIFREGNSNAYNIPLWTIAYEINGTFITVALLAIFGKYKIRYFIYALFILLVKNNLNSGFIVCFVIGIFLNDLNVNQKFNYKLFKSPILHIFLLVLGLILTVYPVTLVGKHEYIHGLMQKFSGNNDLIYRIIGATIIFFVLLNSSVLQKILSIKLLNKIGEVSFSIYVIHLSILGTLTSYMVFELNKYLEPRYSALIAIPISCLVIYIAGVLIHKYIYLNGVKMANFICKKALEL